MFALLHFQYPTPLMKSQNYDDHVAFFINLCHNITLRPPFVITVVFPNFPSYVKVFAVNYRFLFVCLFPVYSWEFNMFSIFSSFFTSSLSGCTMHWLYSMCVCACSLNDVEVLGGLALQHHHRGAEGAQRHRGADWRGGARELHAVRVHERFSDLQQLRDPPAGPDADQDGGECQLVTGCSPIFYSHHWTPSFCVVMMWWLCLNGNLQWSSSSPCRCTSLLVLCMALRGRWGTWSSVPAALAVVPRTQSWLSWKTRSPLQPLRSSILKYRYWGRFFSPSSAWIFMNTSCQVLVHYPLTKTKWTLQEELHQSFCIGSYSNGMKPFSLPV